MRTPILFFLLFVCCSSNAQEKPEGLFINSKAPDFKIEQFGKEEKLKDVLRDSLVVLVFYRGHWDPYCTKYLRRLQDSIENLNTKGARLIAVTPEKNEFIEKMREKTKANFPIVHDKEMKISKAYSVAFIVDEKAVVRYKSADIDLAAFNDQKDKISLPVPAVYVISKEGTILYRYFDTDYKKRPAIEQIISQLK